jgi:pimeloyl-ACP methyl ester carboxylesterase
VRNNPARPGVSRTEAGLRQRPDSRERIALFFCGDAAVSHDTMNLAEYYPYRNAAARDLCFRYLEGLAAGLWPILSEERMVSTTFGATFVRVSGPPAAPTLLLLHGAGTTSLMWAPNIEALSTNYRTVAVDQVGEFGRSVCTRPVQSLQDLVAWLDELIGALDVRGLVSLVGMSYGGALAAQYALHFPERLEKVILLAPGATVLRPPAGFWLRLIALVIAGQRGLRPFFRWIFADMARTNPQWIDATIEPLSLNMRSVQHHKTPFPPVLTDAEWGSLRTPALFLAGEHEVIYSAVKAVRRLKRVAPQVTAEIIPGAGHDLTFAQTAMVNQRMLHFLKGEPASSKAAEDCARR